MIQPLHSIGEAGSILLPLALLQACGIRDRVDVEVRDGAIVLRPVDPDPRAGWDEAFQTGSRGWVGAGKRSVRGDG